MSAATTGRAAARAAAIPALRPAIMKHRRNGQNETNGCALSELCRDPARGARARHGLHGPIAIAYAAAQARAVLGKRPGRCGSRSAEISSRTSRASSCRIRARCTASPRRLPRASSRAGRKGWRVLSEVTDEQIADMRSVTGGALTSGRSTRRSSSTSASRFTRLAIRPRRGSSAAIRTSCSCCTARSASSTAPAARPSPNAARTAAS